MEIEMKKSTKKTSKKITKKTAPKKATKKIAKKAVKKAAKSVKKSSCPKSRSAKPQLTANGVCQSCTDADSGKKKARNR